MGLREYEQSLNRPLREATLTLLLKDREVLLAMKKRGFGVGRWNGVGGKLNPGEDVVSAAIREAQEEIRVTPINLKKVAIFNFHFPLVPAEKNWGQQVHVFTAIEWEGDPLESEEMRPQWFKIGGIPYKEMWPDDEMWMPLVFAGDLVRGSFMFGEGEKITEYYLDVVKSLTE